MAFIILYPAVAALALFIVGVIMIMLRFGPRLCGLRHHALPDREDWQERAYEHEISYA
ncbi:wurmchen 2 transmembrane micropeptide [Musca autumnalis]|uniref:wurmchen 2 transmembrane micropeptide n=1 Tax=Musca autumnalis TaxID=221902 RepID=UPI003CF36723